MAFNATIPEFTDRRTGIDIDDCTRNGEAPHNPSSDACYNTHPAMGEKAKVK